MADIQQQKFKRFKALHYGDAAFVMPNPWDAGSARILEHLGFAALATTSAGYGFSVGKRDSYAGMGRNEILDNAAEIVAATELPVSADLEDGFGAEPADCADTIVQACKVGLVGGSIEDATGDKDAPIYAMDHAIERVRAAADAAKGSPFLLTARAEGFLWGRYDLAETIARLQGFSEAGADVLYAPGLPDIEAIRTVCQEVDKPVNVVMGLQAPTFSVAQLSDAGVRRISVGGSFARTAYGSIIRAAQEVLGTGTFDYAADAVPGAVISSMMSADKLQDRS